VRLLQDAINILREPNVAYQILPVPDAAAAAMEHLAEYSAEELRSFTYTAATSERVAARQPTPSRRAGLLALCQDLCAELRAEPASPPVQRQRL